MEFVLLGAIAATFAHGLLIFAAPESADPHDDWDPAEEPVHAGPDSLYIGVRSAPSGLVHVEVFKGDEYPNDLVRIHSGSLRSEGSKFLLYDPNETVLLTVLTDSQSVNCAVFADEADDPAKVQIFVASA